MLLVYTIIRCINIGEKAKKKNYMNRWHTDIWSHPGHYQVDPYTSTFKVMAKVKHDGHIWGLEFNLYVFFSFHDNQTIFGGDIANSIFDLENSKLRLWPRSNPTVTFEA